MKNQNFFIKAICAGILSLSVESASVSASQIPDDAFSSNANLTLLDSVSSLPVPQDSDNVPGITETCVECMTNPNACVFNSPFENSLVACGYAETLSPYTNGALFGSFYTPIWEQNFVNDLLVSGLCYVPFGGNPILSTLGFPPQYPDSFFPAFVIHDTSNGTLVEKARVNFNDPNSPAPIPNTNPVEFIHNASLLGVLTTAVSPASNQPFAAVSAFISKTCSDSIGSVNPHCIPVAEPSPETCCLSTKPHGPTDYYLYIYKYNPDGTLVKTNGKSLPVDYINFADVQSSHGNIKTDVLTYNAGASFSHDGKYLFVTYLTDTPHAPLSFTGIFAALEIASDGTINTTPAFEVVLPHPPEQVKPAPSEFAIGSVYIPSPSVQTFIPKHSSIYKIIAAFKGIQVNENTGGQVPGSILTSFNFNPVTHSIAQTSLLGLPQTAKGIDLNRDKENRILCICKSVGSNCSSSECLGVDQYPSTPHVYTDPPLTVPDPNKGFRLYSFDKDATSNALTYLTGHDLGTSWGMNARWSHTGDLALMTLTPAVVTAGAFPVPAPIGDFGFGFFYNPSLGSSVLVTLEFNRHKDTFSLADVQPASSIPADIAWSNDDQMVAIAATCSPFQKDFQLYGVNLPAGVKAKKATTKPVSNKDRVGDKKKPLVSKIPPVLPQKGKKKS